MKKGNQIKLTKREEAYVLKGRKRKHVNDKSRRITTMRKASPMSRGERRISEFLISEQIYFRREYYFPGCHSPVTKHLLYFDFWIPEFNLAIEYDGEQHYAADKTDNAKLNDFTKNAYCLQNRINFLRIKYTDFDKIEQLICARIDKIKPIVFPAP